MYTQYHFSCKEICIFSAHIFHAEWEGYMQKKLALRVSFLCNIDLYQR